MSVETETASYKSTDTALLREVVESAELRLQSQLTAALAADQRALVLAGFLSAVIVALASGAAALLLAHPRQDFLAVTALICATGFLIALALTVYAARPVAWNYPGTRPGAWKRDIASKKDEATRLADLAEDLHRKTGENKDIMGKNGRLVLAALCIVAVSLLIGGLAMICFFAG